MFRSAGVGGWGGLVGLGRVGAFSFVVMCTRVAPLPSVLALVVIT